MEISRETVDQGVVLHLHGRFDTLAAPEFEKQIMSVLDKGTTRVIVDCKNKDISVVKLDEVVEVFTASEEAEIK